MRRRILVAIVATVVVALAFAGTGSYVLTQRQAERATETSLRAEARSIAGLLRSARQSQVISVSQQRIVQGLRLEGISVLVRDRQGVLRGTLPDGVRDGDVGAADLEPGDTLSGRSRDLIWAAATVDGANDSVVTVVLTRAAERPDLPVGWFVVGSVAALGVGILLALRLSDTLTRSLRRAEAATTRIAEGDLAVPLPDPAPGDRDEVAQLTRSINAMAAGLAHSRGLERQFLLSVSHDLRTPLTSIRGYADAISDGTATDPVPAAKIISAESQRLARLVGDLLDLARLDAHEFAFDLRPVPIGEVVTETAEGFRPAAEAAGVELSVQAADRATVALIDPDRLAQAIANLVENGLKFALTELRVDLRVDGATATISVADDGPGIAPADVDHVFDRLYVTDRRPRRHVGGTGLGLAIVRQLVGGMGGRSWAESPALPDGRGARFSVSLPTAAPGGEASSAEG